MVPRREALLGSTFETKNSLVALARDGIRDHELRIAIHLGGVDMGHAGIDAALQCGDRALAVAAVEIPGALADDGNVSARLCRIVSVARSPRWSGTGPDLRSIMRQCNDAVAPALPPQGPIPRCAFG